MVAINREADLAATQYYNCNLGDKGTIVHNIFLDIVADYILNNADMIRDIIMDTDDDFDDIDGENDDDGPEMVR